MHIVFYSVVLNHHQAPVADELYKILGSNYIFVETSNLHDMKGATDDYSKRPYLLQAWKDEESKKKAFDLASSADVCIFGGNDSLPFLKERMKLGLLSFQIGERWLKRGWINLLSPNLLRFLKEYHLNKWNSKPLYKLCASAYTAADDYKLGFYKGKCYKWGYFTNINEGNHISEQSINSNSHIVKIMWCARFLKLKHPEIVVKLAHKLKVLGYNFKINFYGDGDEKQNCISLAENLRVLDVVDFKGNVPNHQVLNEMYQHDIFLFTSDKNEGWGAVMNESMSCGCVPVASHDIGSVPYLIKDGVNGMIFETCNLDSLVEKVIYLLENPEQRKNMALKAKETIYNIWSPENAAKCLLKLIGDIQNNRVCSIMCGPGSKA